MKKAKDKKITKGTEWLEKVFDTKTATALRREVEDKKKAKARNLNEPWLDQDLADHAVTVANRQIAEAKVQLLTAELRAAEAEVRCAEIKIAQHASDVESKRRRPGWLRAVK